MAESADQLLAETFHSDCRIGAYCFLEISFVYDNAYERQDLYIIIIIIRQQL